MARPKKHHTYHVRLQLMAHIRSAGHNPSKMRKDPKTTPLYLLLLDAYECIGQLEGEIAELGIKLTMMEIAGDTSKNPRRVEKS